MAEKIAESNDNQDFLISEINTLNEKFLRGEFENEKNYPEDTLNKLIDYVNYLRINSVGYDAKMKAGNLWAGLLRIKRERITSTTTISEKEAYALPGDNELVESNDLSKLDFSFDTGFSQDFDQRSGKRVLNPKSYLRHNPLGKEDNLIYRLNDGYYIRNIGNNRYIASLTFGIFSNSRDKLIRTYPDDFKIDFEFEYFGHNSNSIKIINGRNEIIAYKSGNKIIIDGNVWKDLGITTRRESIHLELDFDNYHRHHRRR